MSTLVQIAFFAIFISCTSKKTESSENMINQKLNVTNLANYPDTVILEVNEKNEPIELKVLLSDSTYKLIYFDKNYLVKVRELNFTNGELDGLATEWTVNGSLFIQRNYKIGKKTGKEEYWYFTGERNGLLYYNENGNLDGEILWWYKNGNLETRIIIEDGVRNDKGYSYTNNGELEYIFYHRQDTLYKKETFKNGMVVKTEILNSYSPY